MNRKRTITITSKQHQSQQNQQQCNSQTQNQQTQTVQIYLRKANKFTKIVTVPTKITLSQIITLVQQEFQIPMQSQILFLHGQNITLNYLNSQRLITLEEKNIIHIHEPIKNQKQSISVILEFLTQEFVKYQQKQCHFNLQNPILQSFKDQIKFEEIDNFLFIQSGRVLDKLRNPKQLFIQDRSLITVMRKKNQVPQNPTMKEQEQELLVPLSDLSQRISKMRKKPISFEQIAHNSPNFKKKNKVMCLQKGDKSKQLEWQSDSSCELGKRELLKNLYRKKQNNQPKLLSNFLPEQNEENLWKDNSTFNLIDRNELKEEIKKLFQSDYLPTKQNDDKKLEPPKFSMNNDCFMEEVEEIDIMAEDIERQDSDKEQENSNDKIKTNLYSSLPLDLRKSIGGVKGTFCPLPLIPTRDFDDHDNQNQNQCQD